MKTLAFIGVGNMAGAILQGITAEASPIRMPYENVILYDILKEKLAAYEALGCRCAESIADAVRTSDTIVLSVKPQQYGDVLAEIRASGIALDGRTFISLAAGVDTDTISGALGGAAVIRTMPNTPLLIGEGMTALCRNEAVSKEAFEEVRAMFASRGRVIELDEGNMNRIIAVNSSAIACFYRMIRALSHVEGTEAELPGVDEKTLRIAAAQAALGAAQMALQKEEFTMDELIAMVTSYKGTTEQMMLTFDREDFDGMLRRAMLACTNRANELGEALKDSIKKSEV